MTESIIPTEISQALLEVQKELKPAKKDKQNPQFKSWYATLESCFEAALPIMHKHGLVLSQSASTDFNMEASVQITTKLIHAKTGKFISSTLYLKPQQTTPQGIGSAITYGRRYGLCAEIGLIDSDDDDGTAASGGGHSSSGKKKDTTPPQRTAKDIKFDPTNQNMVKRIGEKLKERGVTLDELEQINVLNDLKGVALTDVDKALDDILGIVTEDL